MPFTTIPTALAGVVILQPAVFGDARGFFFESFNARDFQSTTGVKRDFVQDNHSRSGKGVLRGLHYQIEHPQGKLVRVTNGEVYDVAVDLRRSSPTFGRYVGVTLSAENKRQLWIPEGFAHGFLAVSESADVLYKTTDYWYPKYERTLLWNDPALGIEWPMTNAPRLAGKDSFSMRLEDAEVFP
jgi:dTDP-4-dehydrorhamnose 3,5-epimerase